LKRFEGQVVMNSEAIEAVASQFPILHAPVRGKRLAYLDNAATTQKPLCVLEAMDHYYRFQNANVHRAVHYLAEQATTAYEQSRDTIAQFFNADRKGVVFTSGSTDAINLVAQSFGLHAGDAVLLTGMEHHSNIVPWQLVGATTLAAPVLDDGSLDISAWQALLARPEVKLVAITHVSNTLGTVNPIADLIQQAHQRGVPVLVDGAQAIAHQKVDFAKLSADFYVMSAHKAYAPTGFGVLLAKPERLERLRPWRGGGDMIKTVAFEGSTWNDLPYRFEAGTPNMAGGIGFARALTFIKNIGFEAIQAHEHALLQQLTEVLESIKGLKMLGTTVGKAGVCSFVIDGVHAQDLSTFLDLSGVAVRTGHHCTMPLMQRFGVTATTRASLAVYNQAADIQQLAEALDKSLKLLR
jgi:cysteine desulfurase/selenocysteine lyase